MSSNFGGVAFVSLALMLIGIATVGILAFRNNLGMGEDFSNDDG